MRLVGYILNVIRIFAENAYFTVVNYRHDSAQSLKEEMRWDDRNC